MIRVIGNTDGTPTWFDIPSNATVAEKGVKQVKLLTTGHKHPRFTVMLTCPADGRKLPPFIIFIVFIFIIFPLSSLCPRKPSLVT